MAVNHRDLPSTALDRYVQAMSEPQTRVVEGQRAQFLEVAGRMAEVGRMLGMIMSRLSCLVCAIKRNAKKLKLSQKVLIKILSTKGGGVSLRMNAACKL